MLVLNLVHLKSVHELQHGMSIPSLVELGVVFVCKFAVKMLHLANDDSKQSCMRRL